MIEERTNVSIELKLKKGMFQSGRSSKWTI